MGEEQLVDPTWSDQGNAPHKLPVFPICIDTSTIIACKQCEGETVHDYCARLLVTFNQHSRQAGMWESHLRQYFDNDLLAHIADMIRKTCVQWDEPHDLKRHTLRAEKTFQQQKQGKDAKAQIDLYALNMYKTVQHRSENPRGGDHQDMEWGAGWESSKKV